MKKQILITSAAMLMALAATGCNGNNQSSESDVASSDDSTSSVASSSSASPIIVDDFSEALSNTRYYAITSSSGEKTYYTEVFTDNFYYSGTSSSGYMIPEEDSGYIHPVSGNYSDGEDGSYSLAINVYGRVAEAKQYSVIRSSTFLGLVNNYVKTFEKVSDTKFKSTDETLISEVAYFFESKLLRYANNIVFDVDDLGRISHLYINEDDESLMDSAISEVERTDVYLYNDWVKNGSIIEDRIQDYKNLDSALLNPKSLYNNQIVKFNAIVTGVDDNGDVYVAQTDSTGVNIGMRIEGVSNKNFEVYDNVVVETTIATNNNVVYGTNGVITYVSEGNYIPQFSEEGIVDYYGGGYYAYYYFSSSTYYADSIYTTYAYVATLPELVSGKDLVVSLVFPNVYSATETYYASFVLPSYLNDETRTLAYNTLKAAGIYGEDDAYELCFDSIIMRRNASVKGFSLQLLPSSLIYKKLTAVQKIEQICGLANFPLPTSVTPLSYKFGKGTDYNLESQYGITTSDNVNGLFVGETDISEDDYNTFISSLETIGVTKYDEIEDTYSYRHLIYTYNGYIIDTMFVAATWIGASNQLSIWIYKSDTANIVRCPTVQERIKEKAPWFDSSSFLRYADSYDADYHVFEISNYANVQYDEPLIAVTLDLNTNVGEDYKKTLVQTMGYKQYKVDGKSYTYKSRGQVHYVFQKDEGQFVDVATYPTTDYTYTGHAKWNYRVEILIYRGDAPITVPTYSDLTPLSDLYAAKDSSLAYASALPSDAKVEVWKDMWEDDPYYDLLKYGYCHRDEAFVYTSNIDEAYESIKTGLANAGYKESETYEEYENCTLYSRVFKGEYYYVFVMKTTKGYVRVINDLGGMDFYS